MLVVDRAAVNIVGGELCCTHPSKIQDDYQQVCPNQTSSLPSQSRFLAQNVVDAKLRAMRSISSNDTSVWRKFKRSPKWSPTHKGETGFVQRCLPSPANSKSSNQGLVIVSRNRPFRYLPLSLEDNRCHKHLRHHCDLLSTQRTITFTTVTRLPRFFQPLHAPATSPVTRQLPALSLN